MYITGGQEKKDADRFLPDCPYKVPSISYLRYPLGREVRYVPTLYICCNTQGRYFYLFQILPSHA